MIVTVLCNQLLLHCILWTRSRLCSRWVFSCAEKHVAHTPTNFAFEQQASPARLNALSAFLAITRKSGIAGLYAGVLPFLVAEAVASAIKVRLQVRRKLKTTNS